MGKCGQNSKGEGRIRAASKVDARDHIKHVHVK